MISFEAARLLAGTPPWDLEAGTLAVRYQQRGKVSFDREGEILVAEWKDHVRPSSGHAIIAAVRPVKEVWLERRFVVIIFRLTQVLTGYCCYGEYLCRIGKEGTARCRYCGESPKDTAHHALAECKSWVAQRRVLCEGLNIEEVRLSLPTLVNAVVGS